MVERIRERMARSKAYRLILVTAIAYAVMRLAIHIGYMVVMLVPALGFMDSAKTAAGAPLEPMVPVDLQIYLDAAARLRDGLPLYPTGEIIEVFQYAPPYALVNVPFLWLPRWMTVLVHTGLHLAAYVALYFVWARIFRTCGLPRAVDSLVLMVPVWLVFSAFWSDLGYLNIYIIVALLGSLLIDALLREKLGASLLWLSLILQTKPHWAFALAVPVLLGRLRFFVKLVAAAAAAYLGIVGITMLVAGPSYVLEQMLAYRHFLSDLSEVFPWRGPADPFLGYNHSVKQVIYYGLGVTPTVTSVVAAVKLALLVPLGLIAVRFYLRARQRSTFTTQTALELAFAFYLGAFIWLDMVWELSLGIVIYTYLVSAEVCGSSRVVVHSVFLPYALLDLWQLLSVVIFGVEAVSPGMYILTDPSIYVPMILGVLLLFYALLVNRLWRVSRQQPALLR